MKIFFKGGPVSLEGSPVSEGSPAPDFTAVNQELEEVSFYGFGEKVKVITSFPSLDTPVCDLQVKRFNEEAAKLPGVRVIGISMDLPFAQKRFCELNGIKNVEVVSDYRHRSFGRSYGLLIKELQLLARSVVVVDGDRVSYAGINSELTEAPDYDSALAAISEAAGLKGHPGG